MVPGLIFFLWAFSASAIDTFLRFEDNEYQFSPKLIEEIPISKPRASHRIGWFKIENGLLGDWSQEVLFPRDFYACGIQMKIVETTNDLAINGN
jgi:hypothetical protein